MVSQPDPSVCMLTFDNTYPSLSISQFIYQAQLEQYYIIIKTVDIRIKSSNIETCFSLYRCPIVL